MKSLVALCTFLFSMFCWADTLQIVTENSRPYNYEENGVIKGTSTDIVKMVLDRSKIPYTIKVLPWARAYDMALHDQNVMIYTIMRLPSREKLFKWVRPVATANELGLYRLKGNTSAAPKTIDEAKKFKVIAYRDDISQVILKHFNFPSIEVGPNSREAVQMLFGERAPLMALSSATLESEVKNIGHSPAEVTKVMTLFKTSPYMAMSLSTPDSVIKKLQKAYDELVAENRIPHY